MALNLPGGVVAGIPDGPLAAQIVPSKRRRSELAGKVAVFANELVALPVLSPEFSHKLDDIRAIGAPEMAALSGRGERALSEFGMPAGSVIERAILQLRRLAEDLDPKRKGGLLNPKKRFGFGRAKPDPERYFRGYLDAQDTINASLVDLARERDAMLRSSVMIDSERQRMLTDLRDLEEAGVTARELAMQLDGRAAQIASQNPVHADKLRAEALFEAEQRAGEIAKKMAVGAQSWMAFEVIDATNTQIITGASQTIDTMVVVLKSAHSVADMLTRHGLVLDRIAALNQAAANIISEDPSPDGEVASDPDALANAFTLLHDALDQAETSRGSAASDLAEAAKRISA